MSEASIHQFVMARKLTRNEFEKLERLGVITPDMMGHRGKRRFVKDLDEALAAYDAHVATHGPLSRRYKTANSEHRRFDAPHTTATAEELNTGAEIEDILRGVDFQDPETWPKSHDGLKVVRAYHDAQIAQQKAQQQSGELLSRADVANQLFLICRTCRTSLEQIPARLADELAGRCGADPVVVRTAIDAQVRAALTSLADELEKMAGSAPTSEPA